MSKSQSPKSLDYNNDLPVKKESTGNELLLEIFDLKNQMPGSKELRTKTNYSKEGLTFAQKRRETAIIKQTKNLDELADKLSALLRAKRHQATGEHSEKFDIEIRKVKKKMWEARTAVNRCSMPSDITYKDGVFFTAKKGSTEFVFLFGLLLHEWQVNKGFFECQQRQQDAMKKDEMRGYHDFNWLTNSKLKTRLFRNNESKANYYRRIRYLTDEAGKPNNKIYLTAKDAKWFIRHLRNVAQKLDRDRAINYTLPKMIHPDRQNDHWQKEHSTGEHRHKFNYYELEEIHSPRPLQKLMDDWGCQLIPAERDMLIKVTLTLRKRLLAIFS